MCIYSQNSTSEMNQTTEGFLSSILNDEDLQLMDMAMNEGEFNLQFCRWHIYFFAAGKEVIAFGSYLMQDFFTKIRGFCFILYIFWHLSHSFIPPSEPWPDQLILDVEVKRSWSGIMFEAFALTNHSEGYSCMLERTSLQTTLQYWRFFSFSYFPFTVQIYKISPLLCWWSVLSFSLVHWRSGLIYDYSLFDLPVPWNIYGLTSMQKKKYKKVSIINFSD